MAFNFKKPSLTKKKAARPAKRKAFKASKGPKFVLFIGDEGIILVFIKGNVVQSRQFVPDASPQSLTELRETFANDTKAPILLVIDTMDQTYVQQTLPPVSSMGVNKLIKRRLEREFGSDDIKGYLLLGRENSGRKDWNFLMISLERSPQLLAWFDFLSALPNYFQGIYLLSVETESLVRSFEDLLGVPKEGTGAEWKFFVSHNKVGGFRQVILRNNRIVFTRLAQPVGESNMEVITGSIEQEILSTIEYMKRLSYSPQAGLDIYIIASSGVKELIDPVKFNANSFHIFTPYETAEQFGIEGATQPTDQFGDVILASIIGCSRKHVLTFSAPVFKTIQRYFRMIQYQRAVAALLLIGALGYAGYDAFDIYQSYSKGSDIEVSKQAAQTNLNKVKADIEHSHMDVQGASDLIDIYNQLFTKQLSPLPFIEQMIPITGSPVYIKSIEWTLAGDDAAKAPAGAAAAAAPSNAGNEKMTASIALEFPDAASDQKAFRIVAKRILSDFKNLYKGFDIKYTSLPEGYLENDRLDIDLNSDQSKDSLASLKSTQDAQLSIAGPVDIKKAAEVALKADQKPAAAAIPGGPPGAIPPPAQP